MFSEILFSLYQVVSDPLYILYTVSILILSYEYYDNVEFQNKFYNSYSSFDVFIYNNYYKLVGMLITSPYLILIPLNMVIYSALAHVLGILLLPVYSFGCYVTFMLILSLFAAIKDIKFKAVCILLLYIASNCHEDVPVRVTLPPTTTVTTTTPSTTTRTTTTTTQKPTTITTTTPTTTTSTTTVTTVSLVFTTDAVYHDDGKGSECLRFVDCALHPYVDPSGRSYDWCCQDSSSSTGYRCHNDDNLPDRTQYCFHT